MNYKNTASMRTRSSSKKLKQHSRKNDDETTRISDINMVSTEDLHRSSHSENNISSVSHPKLLIYEEKAKKWKSFKIRTIYTLMMIIGFLLTVFIFKQIGCFILVFGLQAAMYSEIVKLMFKQQAENAMPKFRRLYYYWFFVCAFFVYGRTIINHIEIYGNSNDRAGNNINEIIENTSNIMISHGYDSLITVKAILNTLLKYHTAISFTLYIIGFISFVISLRERKLYKYQFSQFAYCHVALLIIVAQSTFMIYNIFIGLIWFLLPCSLIICNDVFAYICGFFWGRTPLIPRLSPKKTWEGFIGSAIITVIFSIFWSRIMSSFNLMVCPYNGFNIAFGEICNPDPIFLPRPIKEYYLVLYYIDKLPWFFKESVFLKYLLTLKFSPIQYHMIFFSIFSSIVAPFGGFFASGFKRAFKIKDFGDSIPGHGGVTDRMDCQIIMGTFTYVYYTTFILPVDKISLNIRNIQRLTLEEQLIIYNTLKDMLHKTGMI